MAKTDTENELQGEIARLEKEVGRLKKAVKNKKFGLVWLDVPEEFEEETRNAMPVLKEAPEKAVVNDDGKPTHILIEGDNYHALTCLNYTHKGKIDVIYIDPPYNTGARTWKYNNAYVDKNDPWRHSKWLGLMEKRLRLAKNLLRRDGVIVIAIDDYEVFQLGMLADEVFGEHNRLANITVLNKKSGRTTDKFFATCHEYYLVYARDEGYVGIELFEADDDDGAEYRFEDHVSRYKWRDFLRTGGYSTPQERPNSYYPIYYDDKTGEVGVEEKKKWEEIWPIDSKGNKRVWRQTIPSLRELIGAGDVKVERNSRGTYSVRIKDRVKKGIKPKTVWDKPKYDAATHGTKLLETIIGKARMFEFPKSVYAVLDALVVTVSQKRRAVILDFFAGSGTTAHAVMEMNKQDGGSRQCILCTNNENNICEEVTYPRVERVINGYAFEGNDTEVLYEKKLNVTGLRRASDILEEIEAIQTIEGEKYEKYEVKVEDDHVRLLGTKKITGKKEGLGGSLKYYRTAFIGKNNVISASDSDKVELAHQAGELLALAENTLYKVKENKYWQLYENAERYTAIYFREELDHFEKFVEVVEKLGWPVTVYMFSWGDEEFADEFDHIEGVRVKTIPLPILEIYKSIYSLG